MTSRLQQHPATSKDGAYLGLSDNALSQHGVTTPAGPITKTEKGCIFKVMGASLHNT